MCIPKKPTKLLRDSSAHQRPITILSNVQKLNEKLICRRLHGETIRTKCFNEAQNGGIPQGNCQEPLETLLALISSSNRNKEPLHCFSWDMAKAYDKCSQRAINAALLRLNCPPKFCEYYYKVMGRLPDGSPNPLAPRTAKVWTAFGHCDPVSIHSSCAQGSTLSCFVFAALMDTVLTRMQESNTGCQITHSGESHTVTALGFVDDICSVSRTHAGITAQAKMMAEFCELTCMRVNVDKLEYRTNKSIIKPQATSPRQNHRTPPTAEPAGPAVMAFTGDPGSAPIPVPPKDAGTPFKCLGIHVCLSGDWGPQQKHLNSKVSGLLRHYARKDLTPSQARTIINSCVVPCILYVCRHADFEPEYLAGLQRKLQQATRNAAGLNKDTGNAHMTSGDTGVAIKNLQDEADNFYYQQCQDLMVSALEPAASRRSVAGKALIQEYEALVFTRKSEQRI